MLQKTLFSNSNSLEEREGNRFAHFFPVQEMDTTFQPVGVLQTCQLSIDFNIISII